MSVVQLADMKAHLNVTFTTDDTLIQGKIDAAEDWISKLCRRAVASRPLPSPRRCCKSIRQLACAPL